MEDKRFCDNKKCDLNNAIDKGQHTHAVQIKEGFGVKHIGRQIWVSKHGVKIDLCSTCSNVASMLHG